MIHFFYFTISFYSRITKNSGGITLKNNRLLAVKVRQDKLKERQKELKDIYTIRQRFPRPPEYWYDLYRVLSEDELNMEAIALERHSPAESDSGENVKLIIPSLLAFIGYLIGVFSQVGGGYIQSLLRGVVNDPQKSETIFKVITNIQLSLVNTVMGAAAVSIIVVLVAIVGWVAPFKIRSRSYHQQLLTVRLLLNERPNALSNWRSN